MKLPILWRYLLVQYIKVVLFCTAAFVLLLLTLRLEEIAHFATLGADVGDVIRFIYYQIPYILPIAFPISSLIASIILFRRLSKDHELTAMRAAGLPLLAIIVPLVIAAGFLSLFNFYIVSEQATASHMSATQIKNQLRNVNPLLLLNNRHIMKMKGIYVDTLGPSRLGESASKLIVAMPNSRNDRLNLLIAENVQANPEEFKGQKVTLLSTQANTDTGEKLLIENIDSTSITAKEFSQMVQMKVSSVNNDYLQFKLLSVRLEDLLNEKRNSVSETDLKQTQKAINRIHTEVSRRISVGLAPITFTLLGACCGLGIGRRRSIRGVVIVIMLTAAYLAAYFSARSIDHLLLPSILLYFIPHILIITIAFWLLWRTDRGIE